MKNMGFLSTDCTYAFGMVIFNSPYHVNPKAAEPIQLVVLIN